VNLHLADWTVLVVGQVVKNTCSANCKQDTKCTLLAQLTNLWITIISFSCSRQLVPVLTCNGKYKNHTSSQIWWIYYIYKNHYDSWTNWHPFAIFTRCSYLNCVRHVTVDRMKTGYLQVPSLLHWHSGRSYLHHNLPLPSWFYTGTKLHSVMRFKQHATDCYPAGSCSAYCTNTQKFLQTTKGPGIELRNTRN